MSYNSFVRFIYTCQIRRIDISSISVIMYQGLYKLQSHILILHILINYLISLYTRSFGNSEDQQQRHYQAQRKRPCHSEKNIKKLF